MTARTFPVAGRLRRLPRRVARAMLNERRAVGRGRPLIPDTVLYESFSGNGALDNPEAIFRGLIEAPDFRHLHHIWVLESDVGAAFRAEFAHDSRVRFVRPRSVAYAEALARSQYLVNNATFPPEFRKRDGQTYLNTWHGTPLKLMGYDMPDGAFAAANTMRNFMMADVLLAQNPHMTRMYLDAYRLAGIHPGRILEAGYPRTDRQHLDANQRHHAIAQLADAGIDAADRNLVLYAPTWKGTDFGSRRTEAGHLLAFVTDLQTLLGDQYLVVLKVHQAVAQGVPSGEGRGVLVPNDIPANVMLGLADVLVTDYSSIFVDFLSTGRPIVFFTPDRAEYASERGTYFAAGELPGAVASTIPELADAIVFPANAAIATTTKRWRDEFTSRDDGQVVRRIIDGVFRDTAGITGPSGNPRRSVLLYMGGLKSNGITTSALNLLTHIDHDAVDVSVLVARPRGRDQRANAARIDSRIRQFHRQGGFTGSLVGVLAMRILARLRPSHAESGWETRLWVDEWRRCLGDASFDTVIDFSGYSRLWAQLILHSPRGRRLIWLHNDMAAEVNRLVGGHRRMRRSLPRVFALYRRFDELVSVSQELAVMNANSLALDYRIPHEKFVAARNVIDETSARRLLRDPLDDAVEFRDPASGEVVLPEWTRRLQARDDTRWFVSVGRLSPEKNHARLLAAFALVHAEDARARLVIVGDGPLREDLETQRASLGLADTVVIAGALANPFAVLALADCFVLSSDYEGQPMVLLEAAVAGLPIVTVRFGSVADALPGGTLHVVEQSVTGLAQGMRDYLNNEVAESTLSAERYNARAMREFMALLEPVSPSLSSFETDSSSAGDTSANSPTDTFSPATKPTTSSAPPVSRHTGASSPES